MIQQLFKGRAEIGNDHVIAPIYPYFDESVPQRTRDIEKAKQLLAAAGTPSISAVLHAGQLLEIPDLATLMKSQSAEAGFNLEVAVESLDTFYGAQWCPAEPASPPCSGAAELGIVDYGHRATPDVYLNAALKTDGVWNSSQYSSPEFDAAFAEFQAAIGVDAQKAACKKIETILNEDVPIALPYWYNYLAGSSKKYQGIYSSALGQMFFSSASQV
jgi:peptide/nickel transport system substrate-binding protein